MPGQDQHPAAKTHGPAAPDLFAMQFLLFPEVLHFLCFLPKGLRQLDVTLPHIVYLCNEIKFKKYIYILKKTLLLKLTVVVEIYKARLEIC